MNEEKIKRLSEINDSIYKIENLFDKYIQDYNKTITIDTIVAGYVSMNIDLRILLACLKIEKENLEEEIKGEIKNEQ